MPVQRKSRKYMYIFGIGESKFTVFVKAKSITMAVSRGRKKAKNKFPDCEAFLYTIGVKF